ncbi:MAG: hypothetical protein KF729_36510 [Sandaracinaceae bacterium]|nr:hypothetical protein [Sandaracinaceae bacterium]
MGTALFASMILLHAWPACAQDAGDEPARVEARRLLAEAEVHTDAGRPALAARSYLAMHEVMHGAGLPRAPVALYSAGQSLAIVPGRQAEARDLLRRFLDESTTLTDASDIRDWRSTALETIAELEASIPATERTPPPSAATSDPSPRGPDLGASTSEGEVHPVGPIVLAVGGAGLIAGVIIGAVSLGQAGDFRGVCDDLAMCPTALRPQYQEMRDFSAAADVLYVVGGITAALGLVLTLAVQEGSEERAVAVDLDCGPTGCRAGLEGRF